MKSTYRVAIIGCGEISKVHASAWKNLPEINLVAACDTKFEALASFANAFEVKHTYKDARTMLEKQQPDIVVIGTTPSAHLEIILEGIRNGVRAILCEAPIAMNANDVELMIQVTEKAGVQLTEGLVYRHHPLTLAVKQHVNDGAIGDVRFIRSTLSTALTDRTNWRFHDDLGGGAARVLGCYCVDVIRHLVNVEPKAAWACGTFEPVSNAWETMVGTLAFGEGVFAQFDCGFGWSTRESYEVVGTKGTILVPRAWSNGDGCCEFLLNGEAVNLTGVNPYSAEMFDLCESLEAGQPPLVGLENARRNMRVIDAVTEAARTGKWIELREM
ncbi:MAG: Gfo/Idh/MocA family oxidoreductase [Candidatus Poribacteria bacterium]|nr:Gfo/Idh/MocA family oxidoreductase [Candidatus Poribacteria bacterium]MDE0503964.1 Gfo/Idh/MocA family oxidoreductase [Candidatus Poribacteria bacterium]